MSLAGSLTLLPPVPVSVHLAGFTHQNCDSRSHFVATAVPSLRLFVLVEWRLWWPKYEELCIRAHLLLRDGEPLICSSRCHLHHETGWMSFCLPSSSVNQRGSKVGWASFIWHETHHQLQIQRISTEAPVCVQKLHERSPLLQNSELMKIWQYWAATTQITLLWAVPAFCRRGEASRELQDPTVALDLKATEQLAALDGEPVVMRTQKSLWEPGGCPPSLDAIARGLCGDLD